MRARIAGRYLWMVYVDSPNQVSDIDLWITTGRYDTGDVSRVTKKFLKANEKKYGKNCKITKIEAHGTLDA